MITTRAVPVPLSHHHRRVTQIPAALTNDFADPLLARLLVGEDPDAAGLDQGAGPRTTCRA